MAIKKGLHFASLAFFFSSAVSSRTGGLSALFFHFRKCAEDWVESCLGTHHPSPEKRKEFAGLLWGFFHPFFEDS